MHATETMARYYCVLKGMEMHPSIKKNKKKNKLLTNRSQVDTLIITLFSQVHTLLCLFRTHSDDPNDDTKRKKKKKRTLPSATSKNRLRGGNANIINLLVPAAAGRLPREAQKICIVVGRTVIIGSISANKKLTGTRTNQKGYGKSSKVLRGRKYMSYHS